MFRNQSIWIIFAPPKMIIMQAIVNINHPTRNILRPWNVMTQKVVQVIIMMTYTIICNNKPTFSIQGAQRKWLQLDFSLLRSNERLQRPNLIFYGKSNPFLIVQTYEMNSEVIYWPQTRPESHTCEKSIKLQMPASKLIEASDLLMEEAYTYMLWFAHIMASVTSMTARGWK